MKAGRWEGTRRFDAPGRVWGLGIGGRGRAFDVLSYTARFWSRWGDDKAWQCFRMAVRSLATKLTIVPGHKIEGLPIDLLPDVCRWQPYLWFHVLSI